MFKKHTKCRACGSPDLKLVFSLENQPLANDFKTLGEDHCGLAPLEILFCRRCTLAQLSVVVNPHLLYSRNYPYVTSKSDLMQAHFASLREWIGQETNPKSVLEIGSNDGLFLKFLKESGSEFVVGIDPADNLVAAALGARIPTIRGLFSGETAHSALERAGRFDVVIARHVLGHIDDWAEFVRNLERVSNHETVIVLEVPYVMDFLRNGEFDTCYHEHLSYVGLKPIVELLKHSDFQLHRVKMFPIHGGAIAMMLRHRSRSAQHHVSVDEFLERENITEEHWRHFSENTSEKIHTLRNTVTELVEKGYRVCGFGASAKSTVMIQACGLERDQIEFICDSTPNKQGRLSPNTEIPIVDEHQLLERMPQYAIMFCWNFASEVLRKNQEYLNRGGTFIIPIPELQMIYKVNVPEFSIA